MWRRFLDVPRQGVAPGYTPFQAVSAYDTRAECLQGTSQLIAPGGNVVTQDPLAIEYSTGRQEFACLPKGVVAGVQPSR